MKDLIVENTHADGSLDTIFSGVKDNLKKFGKILGDSAKLIGGDIGFLVKLTFGRLQSVEKIKEMQRKNNDRRKKLLGSISSNASAITDSYSDGKVMSMLIAPGLFFTSETLSGIQHVTSDAFKQEMSEFGLDGIPGLSWILSTEPATQNQFMASLAKCEPGDGECVEKALKSLEGSGKATEEQGVLSKVATKINKIFLISNHSPIGEVLYEADSLNDLPDETKDEVNRVIRKMIDEHLKEARMEWIKGQKSYLDGLVKEAAAVITVNAELAAADDKNKFFGALAKLEKVGGDATKGLDLTKLESTFVDIGKKIKEDKKAQEEIKKQLEEEDIELNEANADAKIVEVVLSTFKSQFLPEMKGALEDYYEEVTTRLTGGMTKEQQAAVSEDPLGQQYMKMVKDAENKLKDSLSNL